MKPRLLRAYAALGLANVSLWAAERCVRAARRDAQPLDLLFGLGAVARFMSLSKNQTRALAKHGSIPTFQLDGILCARRSSIIRHVAALETANYRANLYNSGDVKESAHGERS